MKFCYYDGKGTPNHGFCKCDYCEKRRKRKAKRAAALSNASNSATGDRGASPAKADGKA